MMATGLLGWEDLLDAEPRLALLEDAIRAETPGADGRYCANRAWYGRDGYKASYTLLVGWRRNAVARPRPARARVITLSEVKLDRTDVEARRRADDAAGLGWLWSMEAYSLGYAYLYDLLPCCRLCACVPYAGAMP
jgi:hypothetical protein